MQVVTGVAVFSFLKGLKALEGPHSPGRSRDTVEDRMLGKARPACPDVSHQALLVPWVPRWAKQVPVTRTATQTGLSQLEPTLPGSRYPHPHQ